MAPVAVATSVSGILGSQSIRIMAAAAAVVAYALSAVVAMTTKALQKGVVATASYQYGDRHSSMLIAVLKVR